MNNTIKLLLIFSAGVASGALCTRGYFERKFRLRANEEIESVKRVYNSNLELRFKHKNDDILRKGAPEEEAPKEERVTTNPYNKLIADYSANENRDITDYRKFYGDTEVHINEDKLEEEMAKKEAPTEDTKPYLISDVEYSETMDNYDKLSCTFYVNDRIVVDDMSREVIEPDVLGEDNIEYMINTDQSLIYIRNENIGCDMEISKNFDPVIETGDLVW